jgi:wobble nucleotide-excising tRNase
VVYGQNVMSEGTIRQWCRMFKDGLTNVHDEDQSGQSCVVSDDPVQSVEQNICERWRFTISELNFQKFHTLFSTRLSPLG